MAQHNVTAAFNTLLEAGWTEDQILALSPSQDIQRKWDDSGWIAWNCEAESAINFAAMQATKPAPEPKPRNTDRATERQLAYIRDLIRSGAGEEGGFMTVPADKDLPSLTKREASALISSLKGDY